MRKHDTDKQPSASISRRQRLAAGKAHFRMTSKGGIKFVPGQSARYASLFMFDKRGKVVLRPGITPESALAEIHLGRASEQKRVALRVKEVFPDEVVDAHIFKEGATIQKLVNAYERDKRARRRCIAKYGPKCFICHFSFAEAYGRVATGFIHVHHLRPLSEIGEEYTLDPIQDLRPVCPNCHAVLHLRTPALSIEEVKALIERKKRYK
jgi:hypothetical protein